jgi:hypothetical protein
VSGLVYQKSMRLACAARQVNQIYNDTFANIFRNIPLVKL